MAINPLQPPVNYMAMLPQPNIGQAFSELGDILAKRKVREQAEIDRQKAEEAKAQFATDLQAAQTDGTQSAWLRMIGKYPQFREAFDTVRKGVGEERLKNEFSQGFNVSTALENNRPDVAAQELRVIIEAKKRSGEPTASHESALKLIEAGDPDSIKAAQSGVNNLLAVLDPDRYEKFVKARLTGPQGEATIAKTKAETEKLQKEKLAPSVQEAIDFANLKPEQQKTFRDLQILKKPPAAVTNVSVTNLERTASGELAKLLPDLYEQANSAASQLSDIPRYRKALENAITGPLAEQRLSAARVSNALGFTGDKGINATRELIQGNAEMALRARGLMKGQGQITEGEQKLLVKARAGEIDFSKGELQTLFNVFERASKAQYERSTNLMRSAAGKSETAQMFLDNVSPLPSEEPPKQPAQPAAGAANIRSQADAIIRGGR